MSFIKHNKHNHKHYKRWLNMIHRCYLETDPRYKTNGLVGIEVCEAWHFNNPRGINNFIKWVEKKEKAYRTDHPENKDKELVVCRIDQSVNFTPENCELEVIGTQCTRRKSNVLTQDKVIQMRRFRRMNSKLTLTVTCELFNVSLATGSRAIHGKTWKSVDAIELPYKERNEDNDVIITTSSTEGCSEEIYEL